MIEDPEAERMAQIAEEALKKVGAGQASGYAFVVMVGSIDKPEFSVRMEGTPKVLKEMFARARAGIDDPSAFRPAPRPA